MTDTPEGESVTDILNVSEAARELTELLNEDVRPRDISKLFYDRTLRDDLCPIIGNRRMIPRDYLEQIEWALRRAGKLRHRYAEDEQAASKEAADDE
jgi:hypothetical protein